MFNVTARAMGISDVNVSSDSYVVAAIARYSVEVRNNNWVSVGAYIVLYVP